jgi:hypothetical protein
MNKKERIAYLIGLFIAAASWTFLVIWCFVELFNRIINKAGDPFPVLTTLFVISIMGKLTIINSDFKKIVEWIKK